MANEDCPRVDLTPSEFDSLNADVRAKWKALEAFANKLEKKAAAQEADLASMRATQERLRTHLNEVSHRERVYARRLTHKENEIHDLMAQVNELKANLAPGPSSLRSALLDPAVNLLIARLRSQVLTHKTRLEEAQSELSAWKFTPDSNTGKRLMAKCRLLYQENEELGRVVSSGRLAKLEGDLALQKRFSEEVKKSQSELDEFLQDLDEDVEGMQGTIYFLQQELRRAKEERTEKVENGDESVDGGQEEGDDKGVVGDYKDDDDVRTGVRRGYDDSDHGSDNEDRPLKKRRSSELSLDYNEDDLGLTNGHLKDE